MISPKRVLLAAVFGALFGLTALATPASAVTLGPVFPSSGTLTWSVPLLGE
jgi:hypothetical protein